MADVETRTAATEHQLMPKPKQSLMQKLSKRHEALKLQLRSLKTDDLDHDDQRAPSRASSSSSSAHKDFFKLAPVTWVSKSDRAKTDFAILYDNIADDKSPSPVFVLSPSSSNCTPSACPHVKTPDHDHDPFVRTQRQLNREASASDIMAAHRLYTSSYSTVSLNSEFLLSTPTSSRPSPHQMSDEQMDAWLEQPEDAELHRRRRKHSASSALSDHSPTVSHRYVQRRKITITKAMDTSSSSPVSLPNDNVFFPERDAIPVVQEESHWTLATMPVEIVLEVVKYLDAQSALCCRQTCRKLRDHVPAPMEPLAPNKT
ncbi:hypothetical protein ACEQ8H_003210 [Pleosporales sp. CAS-2024a]